MSQRDDSTSAEHVPQRSRTTIRHVAWTALRPLATLLLVWSSGNWFDRHHWWETWETMR